MSSSPSRLHNCTLSLLTAALLLAGAQATPVLAATAAQPPARNLGDYSFAIAQQPLVSALNAFTAVTGWQVGLPAELGAGVASPGVRGSLPPEKALERLLAGTNLAYRKLGNNSIVLERRTGSTLTLQQMTISATRQEQSIDSVPSTVTVHERQDLDRQNVNTIKELVRYDPGVSVGGAICQERTVVVTPPVPARGGALSVDTRSCNACAEGGSGAAGTPARSRLPQATTEQSSSKLSRPLANRLASWVVGRWS